MIKTLKISGVTKADLTTSNNRERYAWVKNNTGGNVYASVLDSTCTAGADNVAEIAAGDVRMVDTLSLGYLWLSGNGSVEIQLSDSVSSPFKLSQKGGDVSAEGDSLQLGGLQGGVPFSEVTVKGKNLLSHNGVSGTYNGITLTVDTDGKFSMSGTSEKNFMVFKFVEVPLIAGNSYTVSSSETYEYSLFNLSFHINHTDGDYTLITQYPTTFTAQEGDYITGSLWISEGATANSNNVGVQLEYGDTATEYVPPITGQELTITVNGTDYTITPDSNPYTVPTEIYQQDGINTVYVTGEGEPTLSVTGVKTNAAVKRIWDKLNELTTAIIVSNTGFNI